MRSNTSQHPTQHIQTPFYHTTWLSSWHLKTLFQEIANKNKHPHIILNNWNQKYLFICVYMLDICIIYIDIRLVVITDPGRLQAWGSSTVLLSSFFHRIQSTTPVPHGRWAPSPPRWVPAPNEPVAPRIWESKGTGPPNATPPKKEGIMVVHGG